jgi:hypothetical protein
MEKYQNKNTFFVLMLSIQKKFFANFFSKKVITNVARFVALAMKVAIVCLIKL